MRRLEVPQAGARRSLSSFAQGFRRHTLLSTLQVCLLFGTVRMHAGWFWSDARLAELRAGSTNAASPFGPALQQLRADAAQAANAPVFTVTRKKKPGPSGDIHDYVSLATYWWPDPTKPDGLPYIRRDGQGNPEGRGPDSDETQMRGLCETASTLALSWAIFRDENHARHAGKLLRAWFIEPATRMKPHLTYAQAVPGVNEGRGLGIIDSLHFIRLPDAIVQLRGAPGWSAEYETAVRRWFADYLDWLRNSKHGAEARDADNNHGTWYDVQCVTYARFLGRNELAREILSAVPSRRIDSQIESDGRQPRELARTRAWTYSLKNLDGLLLLATLSAPDGPDLWSHRGPGGRGIPEALRFLTGFADPATTWPYPELGAKPRANIISLVWQAAALPGAADLPEIPPPTPEQLRQRVWLQYGKPSPVKTNQPSAIRYLLTQPDGGEDTFWTWPNHNYSGWKAATAFQEVNAALKSTRASQAWVRFDTHLTAESINNSFFRIRHSGPIEIYVNGLKRIIAKTASRDLQDYPSGRRRPESTGRNVYAIHFQHTDGVEPVLDIEWHSNPWFAPAESNRFPDPVLPDAIRDAQVCRGPDGTYYLTGTTGDDAFLKPGPDAWLRSPGIQVFKSTDLRHWQPLGWVWTFERDGTWNKDFGTFGGRGPARGIFAPEIHYLKGKFWLVYSVNHTTAKHRFGIGLACADRPEGPWREMSPEHPLTDGFDPNLFEDDDGKVYLLKHGGEISELSEDMTRLITPPRPLKAENFPSVGYEGVYLLKHQGKYFLTAAEWNVHADGTQSYDSMVAVSTNLFGPYGPRQCALRFGGHNGYFKDSNGNIQATVWCYPDQNSHWQKVSIVPMRITSGDGQPPALMPADGTSPN